MRLTWRALPLNSDDEAGALLTVDGLSEAGITAGFSTRHGGRSSGEFATLNVQDGDPSAESNRSRILTGLGVSEAPWIKAEQVHGSDVGVVSKIASDLAGKDALITDEPGLALAVYSADCVPILLADPSAKRIGVIHAGWRGLVSGVIENASKALGANQGVCAIIGPSIGPCCFEAGDEVLESASSALGEEVVRDRRVDLWQGSMIALRRAGITRIGLAALCTKCEPHRFFSHRAGSAGRQAGVIAIRRGS